jgi:hypothetical protein
LPFVWLVATLISRATWQKAKEMEKHQTSTNDSNIFIILVRPSNDQST